MNNIIEKLGITPAPWKVGFYTDEIRSREDEAVCYDVQNYNADSPLIASAPEMLGALIKDLIEDELFYLSKGYTVDQLVEYGEDGKSERDSFKRKQMVVEKATGKSWSEIKDLLV